MKCERFDRLINLFLDGRLEEEDEKSMREHLAVCERCAARLAAMKSVEAEARKIEPAQPPEEYWDTFAERVQGRLDEGTAEPGGIVSVIWTALFKSPSPRIRFAAGAAAVAIVVIAGAIFLDHRESDILPSQEIARQVLHGKKDLVGKESSSDDVDVEAETGGVEELREKAPEAGVESAIGKNPPPAMEKISRSGEKEASKPQPVMKDETARSKEKTAAREVEQIPPATQLTQKTSTEPVKSGEGSEQNEAATAQAVDKSLALKGGQVKSSLNRDAGRGIAAVNDKTSAGKSAGEAPAVRYSMKSSPAPAGGYLLGETFVPGIEGGGEDISDEELARILDKWVLFIENNPNDTLCFTGYMQVAQGYFLLGSRTGEGPVITAGAKTVEKYIALSPDPETADALRGWLKKIQSLREK